MDITYIRVIGSTATDTQAFIWHFSSQEAANLLANKLRAKGMSVAFETIVKTI